MACSLDHLRGKSTIGFDNEIMGVYMVLFVARTIVKQDHDSGVQAWPVAALAPGLVVAMLRDPSAGLEGAPAAAGRMGFNRRPRPSGFSRR